MLPVAGCIWHVAHAACCTCCLIARCALRVARCALHAQTFCLIQSSHLALRSRIPSPNLRTGLNCAWAASPFPRRRRRRRRRKARRQRATDSGLGGKAGGASGYSSLRALMQSRWRECSSSALVAIDSCDTLRVRDARTRRESRRRTCNRGNYSLQHARVRRACIRCNSWILRSSCFAKAWISRICARGRTLFTARAAPADAIAARSRRSLART